MRFLISIRAIAISFVASLLSAILISPTPVSATEVAQADAKNASTKYVNADFGFTFSLPKGWTLKEIKKNRRIQLQLSKPYPSGDEKGWVLIQYIGESDLPLEAAATNHSTYFRNSAMSDIPVKITVLKTHKTPLASGQFAAFFFEKWQSTEHRNVHLIRINAYTLLGKKLFVLTTDRNVDYWEKMQPDFQMIVNSFAAAKQ